MSRVSHAVCPIEDACTAPPPPYYRGMSANCWQFFFMSSAVFLAGCHAPPQAEGPTELKVRIPDRDTFIDRALTALRERDFQPRIADRREGLIVAGPTTSAQWF